MTSRRVPLDDVQRHLVATSLVLNSATNGGRRDIKVRVI